MGQFKKKHNYLILKRRTKNIPQVLVVVVGGYWPFAGVFSAIYRVPLEPPQRAQSLASSEWYSGENTQEMKKPVLALEIPHNYI